MSLQCLQVVSLCCRPAWNGG